MVDDKDFEAQTGVESEELQMEKTEQQPKPQYETEHMGTLVINNSLSETNATAQSEDGGHHSNSKDDSSSKITDTMREDYQFQLQTEEENFEAEVLTYDEEWRDLLREARFYPDQLLEEIFHPNQPWNKWQTTSDYSI